MKKLTILSISIFTVFTFFYFFNNIKIDKNYLINKKAIVIGATSGMGRQVAKLLAQKGCIVGLVGRRKNLLENLQKEIPTKTFIKQIDITKENSTKQLDELIEEVGGLDTILISVSCYLEIGSKETNETRKKIIDTDLLGFWKIANFAVGYFENQKHGHLVGISSIDGLRGFAYSPEYSASKAFISTYLEAIRNRFIQKNIPIYSTDIIPGFIEVENTNHYKNPNAYWVETKEEAAKEIVDAIIAKKKKAYITSRWRIIAWILAILPDCIFNRINI